ncbi:MAG TPA: hypothetical protein PKX87_07460, partial [Alphaproteobacteria bacterium]|nr:hypothetical protein [Alphaproteobacteria bacterium]
MVFSISRRIVLISLTLPLAACVSREQADARLARGCAAAAELFLPEGTKVKEINGKTFGSAEQGEGFRSVTLKAVETDGWSDVEVEYRCVFE